MPTPTKRFPSSSLFLQNKSESKLIASVQKQDSNAQKVKRTLVLTGEHKTNAHFLEKNKIKLKATDDDD